MSKYLKETRRALTENMGERMGVKEVEQVLRP